MSQDLVPPQKGSIFRTIVAIAWSFIGIRKSSEFQEDIARITPLHIMVVGFVAIFLFVIGLMLLVKLVVAT
ncbi:MAG: DUF2970 domain-containing protein [Betaproteobacteria bacterium]